MKSESRRSGSLLPRSGNMHDGPRGVSPCGIDGDVSRDTPALAFGVTVPFSRSHHSTPERSGRPEPRTPFRKRRADTHLCLHHSREGRGRQERPCQSTRKSFSGRTGDTTGCPPVVQLVTPILCSAALVSPSMGSSGTKKSRKGGSRQHLAKVGTPAERSHTIHAAERDVAGNFGVRGKGRLFWTAVCVIALIVAGSLLGLIFWF